MSAYSHLGLFLRGKRIDAGLTQAELADQLGGMLTQFVSNWERGLCAPPSASLSRLIAVLKLDRADLVDVMVRDSRVMIERKIYPAKKARRKKAI